MQFDLRRLTPAYLLSSALALLAAWLMVRTGDGSYAQIVRGAAGIGSNAEGLSSFVDTCNKLLTPAVIAAGAVTPLAVVGGGVAMAFGSRRGLPIVLTALGVLALLGSVKGIVA